MKYVPTKKEVIGMKLILFRHYNEKEVENMSDDIIVRSYYALFGRIRLEGVNHNIAPKPEDVPGVYGMKFEDYMKKLGQERGN